MRLAKTIFLFWLMTLFSGVIVIADAAPKQENWKPLFNGRDFSNWYIWSNGKKNADTNHLFQIHDGMIHMYADAAAGSAQPAGYIATEKEYSHYRLRFEYKWGTKKFAPRTESRRDAGLMYHMIGNDVVWPMSVECQVQENDVGDAFMVYVRAMTTVDPATTNLVSRSVTNSVTHAVKKILVSVPVFKEPAAGGVPFQQGLSDAIRRVVRSENLEVPSWNTVEVIVNGDSAVHIVNGKVNNRLEHLEHFENGKWVPLDHGKILFQQEFAEVFYRNIEILELDK